MLLFARWCTVLPVACAQGYRLASLPCLLAALDVECGTPSTGPCIPQCGLESGQALASMLPPGAS